MQMRTDDHTRLYFASKEEFEVSEHRLHECGKRFFKLFQESSFEGSRAAALEMKKIAR
jgi:hypothetical protein